MNPSFKTEFHNGEKDNKPIVTASFAVKNGKRFKNLDRNGKSNLVETLVDFKKKLEHFTAYVILSMKDDNLVNL